MQKILYLILAFLGVFYLGIGNYSQVVVLIILVLCIKNGVKSEHLYNPYNLLVITQVSFLSYIPSFGGLYFSELCTLTQIIIALAFVSLFIGLKVGKRLNFRTIYVGDKCESIWIVGALGLIPTVVSYIFFGNVLSLSGDELLDAKAGTGIPIIGQLAFFLPVTIIIACKKNNTKLFVISLTISVLAALMTVTKMAILVSAVFAIIGLNYYKPDFIRSKAMTLARKTAIIWIPLLLLFAFSSNNSIRREAQGSSVDFIEKSNVKIGSSSEVTEGLFLNYLYFASPWSNFDYNIRYNHVKGHGINTFAQFAKRVGVKVETVEKIQPSFLNTHSFLTDYVIDFGTFGCIVACFLLGIFISLCYHRYGCSDDPLLLGFYSLVAFATCMLFFSNHFNNGYLLNYFISFGIYYLCSKHFGK